MNVHLDRSPVRESTTLDIKALVVVAIGVDAVVRGGGGRRWRIRSTTLHSAGPASGEDVVVVQRRVRLVEVVRGSEVGDRLAVALHHGAHVSTRLGQRHGDLADTSGKVEDLGIAVGGPERNGRWLSVEHDGPHEILSLQFTATSAVCIERQNEVPTIS